MAHAASPATLLALARDVFGHAPEAWWLTIPRRGPRRGRELSPLARARFRLTLREIKRCAANLDL